MRWIWKLNLWLTEGKGKRRNRKLKNETKIILGQEGRRRWKRTGQKQSFGCPWAWVAVCLLITNPFFSEVWGRLRESRCLKGNRSGGSGGCCLSYLSKSPTPSRREDAAMCPCGLGSGCSRGSLHLSQGARVWRLRCVKDVQLKWDGCCPGDGPQSFFSQWVESLRLVQFKKVEITLESFKMFVNEMSKNK